jgi:site-specific recombinase XerD
MVNHDKTGSRRLTLPASTAEFIKDLVGNKIGNTYIFSSPDGKAWNKDKWKTPIREAVHAASSKTNVPKNATAYTFRHSIITDLVHQGLDLLSVAQLAGTSVRMVEKHYGHLRATVALPALATLSL